MNKRTLVKYPKWEISNQIHNVAFVKIIPQKLKKF